MSYDSPAGDPGCETWETWVKANSPQPDVSAAIYSAADIVLDAPPDAEGYPQMAAQALGIRLAAAGFSSLTIERAIEWLLHFGFLLERPERSGILRNTRLMGQVAAGRWAAVFGERPAKRVNQETTTAPPVVVEFLGDGKYQAGKEIIKLDGNEALVLESLVRLQAATRKELFKRSGIDGTDVNAGRILKAIRDKYPPIAACIRLPGKKSAGGYSTTIRPGKLAE